MRRTIPGALGAPKLDLSHLALYRKYRSQTFGDLVGQEHVVRTIQNALRRGQYAHAYLFTGPRGTGKTSTARLVAKALNCEQGIVPEPCDECHFCKAITIGSCMDVVEIDAASESGVEDVRDRIIQFTEYKPAEARFKMFIIDEVHDLSAKAFDALLKTIEEPPPHVVFVLATTELNKVPPTIRSRCQTYEFHRATLGNLRERLAHVAQSEGVEIEEPALTAIAKMADGGFRDALTLLEQAIITVTDGPITVQHVYDQLGLIDDETADSILMAIRNTDVKTLLQKLDQVYRLGRDPRSLLESLMIRLSDLTRAAYGVDVGADSDATVEASTHAAAKQIGLEPILMFRGRIAEAHKQIRDISIPRLWLEAELVRIATSPATLHAAPARASTKSVPPATAVSPAANGTTSPEVKPEPPTPIYTEPLSPELQAANEKWELAKEKLAQYPAYRMKLAESRIGLIEKGKIRIDFDKRLYLDWVKENANRMKLISEAIREQFGDENWKVEYALQSARKAKAEQVEAAVELPAEGERLGQIAREVFEGL